MSSAQNKLLITNFNAAAQAIEKRAKQLAGDKFEPKNKRMPTLQAVTACIFKDAAAKFTYGNLPTCLLGEGTFGKVFSVLARSHQKDFKLQSLAIKIVGLRSLRDLCLNETRELRIWRDYASKAPYTMPLLDHFPCERQWQSPQLKDCYAFVMPQATRTLHAALLKRDLSLENLQNTILRLTRTLCAFGTMGVVHADMRPENIFLDAANNAFLGDFSSSRLVLERCRGLVQSRWYRAPEVILGFPFDGGIDMWSLGCIIYEMFTGWPLFPCGGSEDTPDAILKTAKEHMRLIMEQIGMPPTTWLDKCLPSYREELLKQNADKAATSNEQPKWQAHIASSALKKGTSQEFVQHLTHFLSRIFCYEKRMRPQEALKMAFLQTQIKVSAPVATVGAAAAAAK